MRRNLFQRMFDGQDAVVDPLAQQRLDAMSQAIAQSPVFVDAAILTVDQVLTTYPASAANRGKYARVSDYAGYVDRVLRCDYDLGLDLYYWNPTQAEYARTINVTADMTLVGLKSPSSIVLGGSVAALSTRNVTLSLVNRRPGEIIEIKNGLASLLGTLNLIGTGIGTIANLAVGGYMRIAVDGSGGSLQLVRLQ